MYLFHCQERIKRKGQLLELDGIWDSYRSTLLNEQSEKRKAAKVTTIYIKCLEIDICIRDSSENRKSE